MYLDICSSFGVIGEIIIAFNVPQKHVFSSLKAYSMSFSPFYLYSMKVSVFFLNKYLSLIIHAVHLLTFLLLLNLCWSNQIRQIESY